MEIKFIFIHILLFMLGIAVVKAQVLEWQLLGLPPGLYTSTLNCPYFNSQSLMVSFPALLVWKEVTTQYKNVNEIDEMR